MKKTLKLIFFFVIIFIAITMSKTVNAAEENMANVEYKENTDGTVKVTMTFSENVEKFTKLENSGWTLWKNGHKEHETRRMVHIY